MKQKTERDSNLELLRIVAMIFIVLHHFIVHGCQLAELNSRHPTIFPKNDFTLSAILLTCNAFFIVGVNVFILISGYYSIKIKWKTIFSLLAVCLFYDYAQMYVSDLLTSDHFEWHFGPVYRIFIRSGWFITCYMALMFLSPILNKAIDHFSDREKIYVLLGLCLLNLWFGFHLRADLINDTGYKLMQFIFIYYIGRCLNNFEDRIKWNVFKSVGGYIVCSLVLAGIVLHYFHEKQFNDLWMQFNYNNPLVVLSSVFLFWTFRNLQIRSKIINWCSSSVLAVYLIHESPFVGGVLYPFIIKTHKKYGFFSFEDTAILFVLFVTIMLGSILVDKIRVIITNPMVSWSSRKARKIQCLIEERVFDRDDTIK
jgi:Uncharacterized protein conserved in bacteria